MLLSAPGCDLSRHNEKDYSQIAYMQVTSNVCGITIACGGVQVCRLHLRCQQYVQWPLQGVCQRQAVPGIVVWDMHVIQACAEGSLQAVAAHSFMYGARLPWPLNQHV